MKSITNEQREAIVRKAVAERDAILATPAGAIGLEDPLTEALLRLRDAANESDVACYGNLTTTFVRDICNEALAASPAAALAEPVDERDAALPVVPAPIRPPSLDVALSMCREANSEAKLPAPMCWDLALYVQRLEQAFAASKPALPVVPAAVLPYDVTVGGGTFCKGVSLSTFVKAAQRWHREAFPDIYNLTDEQKAENLARLQGFAAPAKHAEITQLAATPPDREALILAKDALTEISAMYSHTWDRADDGALVMLPLSIPRFEAAHEKVLAARTAVLAAIAAQEGKS